MLLNDFEENIIINYLYYVCSPIKDYQEEEFDFVENGVLKTIFFYFSKF